MLFVVLISIVSCKDDEDGDIHYDFVEEVTTQVTIQELNTRRFFGSNTVNAACLSDGSVILTQEGGEVFLVSRDTARRVLYVPGARDWRGVWMDSNENVFVSPHSSAGGMDEHYRGIYKMSRNDTVFRKVLSLCDSASSVTSEREDNDDTMWTFCEDSEHNLYAGVYAHTVRPNPSIYKSTDAGEHWSKVFDFNEQGLTSATSINRGMHIHSIIFNPYDKALYCIVGELNEIFRSRDGGLHWENLGIQLQGDKGSSMLAVPDGLIVGSDGAYSCMMSKVYLSASGQPAARTTARLWANTVFAIRRSPDTGWIYAFTKIDSSVRSEYYYPPQTAESDANVLQNWLSAGNNNAVNWSDYYNFAKQRYPEDAVHPHHCTILISMDNGETWKCICTRRVDSLGPAGFWTASYFSKGQCLAGYFDANLTAGQPLILNEHITEDTKADVFGVLDSVKVIIR